MRSIRNMLDDYLTVFCSTTSTSWRHRRLGPVWRKMLENRDYPAPVSRLLGEMSATTLLLGGKLKQPGRLTIQLRGNGPVSLLVIDCNEQLQIRGMARCDAQPNRTPCAHCSATDSCNSRSTCRRCASPIRASCRSTARTSPKSSSTTSSSRTNCLRASFSLLPPTRWPDSAAETAIRRAARRGRLGARRARWRATVKPGTALRCRPRNCCCASFHEETVRLFAGPDGRSQLSRRLGKGPFAAARARPGRSLCRAARARRGGHQGRHLQSRVPFRRAGHRLPLSRLRSTTSPTLH
jgi:hypothetical protein